MVAISETPEWQALLAHHETLRDRELRDLFEVDPARGDTLVAEVDGLLLDYSKHRLTAETIDLVAAVARRAGVEELRDAMFRGDPINITEGRSVLHIALRAPRDAEIRAGGVDVVPEVDAVLDRMSEFADRIRSGAWTGNTGRRIEAVVNIGI